MESDTPIKINRMRGIEIPAKDGEPSEWNPDREQLKKVMFGMDVQVIGLDYFMRKQEQLNDVSNT